MHVIEDYITLDDTYRLSTEALKEHTAAARERISGSKALHSNVGHKLSKKQLNYVFLEDLLGIIHQIPKCMLALVLLGMLLKMPDFQKCTSTNGPGEMNGK